MSFKRKKKVPAFRAEVEWIDASFSAEPHWTAGTQPKRPTTREHVCVSVGWLTHLDEHFVQLTQTLTDGSHAHTANIPRGMVRRISVLEIAGELEF